MKALRNISLLIIALITISSCTEEKYYPSDVYQESWYVDEFQVMNNHWRLVGNPGEINSYYQYEYSGLPLSESYYKGVVTAYLYFGYETSNEAQTPLPYTEYKYDADADEYYSIQYTYDVKPNGQIIFYAYVSDFYTNLFEPGTQTFRVAIVY